MPLLNILKFQCVKEKQLINLTDFQDQLDRAKMIRYIFKYFLRKRTVSAAI